MPPESKNNPLMTALDKAVEKAGSTGRTCELSFHDFLKRYPIAPNYAWGRHTHALAEELEAAAAAVERGECYYAIVTMPPRHGKSDLCSRRFPPWFLCRNPDMEVMLAAYGQSLADDMSRDARKCFAEAGLDFGLKFADDCNTVTQWKIQNKRGGFCAAGLDASATGKGAHILIVDDYYKNRAAAESEGARKTVLESFQCDFMTRLAPAHAVIIVANRWGPSDLVASILSEMEVNPDYPRFKLLNFPAWDETLGWLFPERFSDQWYKARKAVMSAYGWESQYQGNPKPRTGKLLRGDLANLIDASQVPEKLRQVRGWDLASTEKQRNKDDPDFTAGVKSGWLDLTKLYVTDVKAGQWGATLRDKIILQTAKEDGPRVVVKIESVAGYKDTYTRMRDLLKGKSTVKNSVPKGDKVTRAEELEPLFEAGNVYMVVAPWNKDFIGEINAFPNGDHDDRVDALVISATEAKGTRKAVGMHG